MKKQIIALLLLFAALAGLLTGCGAAEAVDTAQAVLDLIEAYDDAQDPVPGSREDAGKPERSPAGNAPETSAPSERDRPAVDADAPPAEAGVPEEENAPDSAAITQDGEYSSPEDVAEYLHTYGKLPGNFITKNAARDLGWDSSKGNLWDVAPGKSIGGDYFGNYEGLLPEGKYRECDVNYAGGYRGAERLIYGEDGSVWYTNDHYQSFTQLY